MKINRKAQSFLDYAVLIAVIIVSLLAMSRYVLGSINARVARVRADLRDPLNGVR
ncbi:MAG: hypothetical protein PHV55_04590 [Candidatus Omnitrophica bacterium]|nr:hypothetical protein [Candidatus Omnitrophota bacterium]